MLLRGEDRIRYADYPETRAAAKAGNAMNCPHACSHRGSHCGVCMTCGCPTSALPGGPIRAWPGDEHRACDLVIAELREAAQKYRARAEAAEEELRQQRAT